MIKAALIPVVLAALLFFPATGSAQDAPAASAAPPQDAAPAPVAPAVSADTAAALAAQQAVKNQADAIELQNKLVDAQATLQRGDVVSAAKLYQDCYNLSQQIGPGIPQLAQQAVEGLTTTCMALAKDAQSRGDYREANVRVMQVLKANPKNQEAIAFKARNDQMMAAQVGHVPDSPTIDRAQQLQADQVQAATLSQDGKLLYEMGKIDEAQTKLEAAQKLDPDNQGANYYLELIDQQKYKRATEQHNIDTEARVANVEKQWVLPRASALLPTPNPYATNSLTYTGPGRQSIIAKLNSIRLDDVNYDGLPLNEVLRQLSEQSKLRDPERKGINFLINPNPDLSGPPIAVSGTGFGGDQGGGAAAAPPVAPAAAQIDPSTGLPIAPGGAPGGGGGGGEGFDLGTAVSVKLSLTDERLCDVLDAIVLVAEHPPGHQIKYTIQDFGVIFEDKGEQTPQLFTRTFKVDPNTFFSGLESVGSTTFGSVTSSGGSGGSSGGGSSGGSGGQNGQGGAVVGVVNAFSGAGSQRSSGGQGGGGGGGGGGGQGSSNPLNSGQGGQGGQGGGGNSQSQGGLNFVTTITLEQQVSAAARAFFTSLGVNLLAPPGKSVFFNERSGILLVRATEQDLDTIDKAIQALDTVAPQVHIKARFIEVQQNDSKQMGFDWYLGQFQLGSKVVGQGGNPGSLNVPPSPSNPLGTFPGATPGQLIPDGGQQIFNSGLSSATAGATTATITGILTNPNFQVVMHMLDQRAGIETLAEPEVVTTSGRQTQMRATQVITVITGVGFQQGTAATTTTGTGTTP